MIVCELSCMSLSRKVRLSSRQDFEYAIKWEHVRADYFRSHGYRSRADDCVKAAKELEWRLAMASTTGDNDVITGDALVDAGWVPEQEAVKGS